VFDALDSGCCSSGLRTQGWDGFSAQSDSSTLTGLWPVQQQQQQAWASLQQPCGLSYQLHNQQQQQRHRWLAEPLREPQLEQQLLSIGTQVQRLQQKAAAGGSAEEALQGTVTAQLQQWRRLRQQQEQRELQAACEAAVTSSGRSHHHRRRRKQGAARDCYPPREELFGDDSATAGCSHFWGGTDHHLGSCPATAAAATLLAAGMGSHGSTSSSRGAFGGELRRPYSAGAAAALLHSASAGPGDSRLVRGAFWSPQKHSRTSAATMRPADAACQWHAASRSAVSPYAVGSSSSRWLLQTALQECRQEAWEQQVLAGEAAGVAAEAQVVSAAIRCTAGLFL
jgi:hypothetical protein